MSSPLAEVALPVPLDQTFTYTVPSELQTAVQLGVRVIVPFGKKFLTGVIVALPTDTKLRSLKPIKDILDPKPSFSDDMLKLCHWMSEYYFAPLGEVLKAASPHGLAVESKKMVRLKDPLTVVIEKVSSKQQRLVLDALRNRPSIVASQLQKLTRIKSFHATLNELKDSGLIRIEEEIPQAKVRPKKEKMARISESGRKEFKEPDNQRKLTRGQLSILGILDVQQEIAVNELLKSAKVSLQSVKGMVKKDLVEISEREVVREAFDEVIEVPLPLTLNGYQERSLTEIRKGIDANEFKTFLLLGVTGSGKTQVYIESIRSTLAKGKTAIVLVPEISLTPQTVRRFRAHFGKDVTVMHSQMSPGERYDAWR